MSDFGRLTRIPVTIAISTSLSPSVDIGNRKIVAIEIPSTVASWQTANLTFQGSSDNASAPTNFTNVYDAAGNEFIVIVGALSDGTGRFIPLTGGSRPAATTTGQFYGGTALEGMRFIKVRSGTSGSAVT